MRGLHQHQPPPFSSGINGPHTHFGGCTGAGTGTATSTGTGIETGTDTGHSMLA